MMFKTGRAFICALSVLLVTLMLMSTASAQTKKKKRHVTHRSTAAKKTTAAATSGDAGVVSLADQYQDTSTQIIDPSASPSPSPGTTALPDETTRKLKDLQTRIKKLETAKPDDYDTKQKRLLTNLDILTKAEQRSEDLRKQRFELVEKENTIRLRLAQIDIDSRPEMIDRSIATMGSLRPEELREAKRKSLDAEKQSLQSLLNDVTTTRAAIDQSLLKSDALVDKLREKLEKDIDDSLDDKPEP